MFLNWPDSQLVEVMPQPTIPKLQEEKIHPNLNQLLQSIELKNA